MPDKDTRLNVIVIGRVQGVGFRMFVQSHADKLGLVGYVRNDHTDRRRLEVVAEGGRENLEELLRRLQVGPGGARVEDVQVSWGHSKDGFNSFRVTS